MRVRLVKYMLFHPQKTQTEISRLTMKTRLKAKSADVPPETNIHGQQKQGKHQERKRKALLPTDAVQQENEQDRTWKTELQNA